LPDASVKAINLEAVPPKKAKSTPRIKNYRGRAKSIPPSGGHQMWKRSIARLSPKKSDADRTRLWKRISRLSPKKGCTPKKRRRS